MSILLDVKNLKKHFSINAGGFFKKQTLYAVDGVSFRLREGETIGIVGESGCGKSTLGRTILRLHEPTSGTVEFMGQDIARLKPPQMRGIRRDMQIIFQDPFSSLNPRMTVGQILAEPFQIHKLASGQMLLKNISDLLDIVGLSPEVKDRYPHEFSGGQRQRIGIARAIALRPKLIIADEPVSALDVSIQSQILNLMGELRKKFQLSYLFIAHDLAVIEHISDWVAVMYLGRIVEFADVKELYRSPRHPYTRALIAAIPEPVVRKRDRSSILEGDVPSPLDPPRGCHFNTRCPNATEHCRQVEPTVKNLGTDDRPVLVACHYAGEI
jgi:peptide/nickel transport system ATP-binding protein